MKRFALTKLPTPVLNIPHFHTCFAGDTLPLDAQKLLRPIETVLFPHTKVELIKKVAGSIWQIETKEYPSTQPLFVDERFLESTLFEPVERKKNLPSASTLLSLLQEQLGQRYIWGGNWPTGIPQLLTWYPPSIDVKLLEPLIYDTWQLKGMDCSGLIYYVSDGYTPRNTSDLVTFGNKVSISGKNLQEMVKSVLPLDMIVWKGHVVFVLDEKTAIESKGGAGVIATPLHLRLQEILENRKPVEEYTNAVPSFVIRRWHAHQ